MNYWKITSIILIFIIVGIFIALSLQNNVYDFGDDIKIKKSTLENIAEEIGSEFTICDISRSKCLNFRKLN